MTKDKESRTGRKKEEERMWKTQMTKTDVDHDLCVISSNVNKSSAQHDLLSAGVAMFQEIQNWKEVGIAEEIG